MNETTWEHKSLKNKTLKCPIRSEELQLFLPVLLNINTYLTSLTTTTPYIRNIFETAPTTPYTGPESYSAGVSGIYIKIYG